jgi:hypothetical protein
MGPSRAWPGSVISRRTAHAAGWSSLEVIASLAAGVAVVAAFVLVALRAREPMLPIPFFRKRAFAAGNAGVFFLFASLFGAVFFLAQFLRTGMGYSPLEASLRLVPWTATRFVITPLAGALVDRIGDRPLLVGGLVLQAVGMGRIALRRRAGPRRRRARPAAGRRRHRRLDGHPARRAVLALARAIVSMALPGRRTRSETARAIGTAPAFETGS